MPARRIMLDVLKGKTVFPPPLWMMRQAGRYLPEYRETRRRAGSFLDLCYDPDLAVEVTLQPIERFGFDASIVFSDILVVPHALGRDVRFEEGRGPLLTPISAAEIAAVGSDMFHVNLEPVYETLRRLRAKLPDETTLIGFCGAPWTVATYMIAGHGTPDQAPARLFAYREPAAFRQLLKVLTDHSASYLIRQIEAGADVVQIFDSWSGVLDDATFEEFCVEPVAEVVRQVRAVHPDVPIIGFPKGAGARYQSYRERTGVTGLGIDWTVPLEAAKALQRQGAVQGNLDPLRLVAGGQALADGVGAILRALGDGPLIFNLGHGITPDTPVAHVEAMVKQVRSAAR
ncbi:uroporphyrinogen decarboxylase [Mesorhizobium salmacidum]|uniref:Uroporphyrinogen decarboxylase n=1 Tax=Mesorhizobium salmacidum TaxID=3015171 RepID=A0ABU8L6U9_9HYPH